MQECEIVESIITKQLTAMGWSLVAVNLMLESIAEEGLARTRRRKLRHQLPQWQSPTRWIFGSKVAASNDSTNSLVRLTNGLIISGTALISGSA